MLDAEPIEAVADAGVDVVDAVQVGEEPQHLVDLHARGEREVPGGEADVLHRRAPLSWEGMAEQLDGARVGADHPDEHQKGRRLARAVRAEQSDPVAGRDFEVDPGDGLGPPERLRQPMRSDDQPHEGAVSRIAETSARLYRLSSRQVAVGA